MPLLDLERDPEHKAGERKAARNVFQERIEKREHQMPFTMRSAATAHIRTKSATAPTSAPMMRSAVMRSPFVLDIVRSMCHKYGHETHLP
jgi:hypothetical protein